MLHYLSTMLLIMLISTVFKHTFTLTPCYPL